MSVVHVNTITLWVCFVLLAFPKPYFCATTARDVVEETTTVISTTTEVDSTTQQDTTTESENSTTESEDSSTATTVQTEEPDSGETLTTTSQTPTSTDSIQDIDGTTEPSVAENEINPRFDAVDPQNGDPSSSDSGYFYDPPNSSQGLSEGEAPPASDSSDSGYFYEKPSIPFEFESVNSDPVETFNGYEYPKPEKIFTYPWEAPSNQIYTDYNDGGFRGYY